jgi:hypothetical protein
MSDPDGRRLLMTTDFPADLLRMISVGSTADSASSLFIGLMYEIESDHKFKGHFIESGFLAHIRAAYEQLGSESPNFEICNLLKAIMRRPIEDDWVRPISSFFIFWWISLVMDHAWLVGHSRHYGVS